MMSFSDGTKIDAFAQAVPARVGAVDILLERGLRADGAVLVNHTQPVGRTGGNQLGWTLPLRRFGKPSETADAVMFVASDRASYVTGQVLSVSGGLTMVG